MLISFCPHRKEIESYSTSVLAMKKDTKRSCILLHPRFRQWFEIHSQSNETEVSVNHESCGVSLVLDFVVLNSDASWKGLGGIAAAGYFNNIWDVETSMSYFGGCEV